MRHNLAKLITPEMLLVAVGLLAIFAVTLILPPVDENAVATDATTEFTASIDDFIAISAPTTLDLTVTPTADSATLVSGEVTVSVSTNSLYGYNLTMGTAGTNVAGNLTTNLVNGENSATIPTLTSSATALDDDTWGFTTDNNTESDTIYGQVTAGTYLPLTTTASPTLIKGNTETVANDTTTVTFAASVTNNLAAGSYTNTVEFNAVANLYDVSGACFTTSENSDGTLTITGYDVESCGTDVVIPETIMGKTVKKIGRSSMTYIGLTSVSIPSTVTEIGNYALRNNKITSLTLNEGLVKIGMDAFQNNLLTEVNIPSTVTSMGGGTFAANSLTGDDAFIYGRNSDGSIDYTTLDSYAGKNATGTTIPETVTTLGMEAYYLVTYEEIDVPARIKEIPQYCFAASWATKITLHEGLEVIRDHAFQDVSAETIDIPSTATTIDDNVFANSSKITTINVDRAEDMISGSPWGATNATVNWVGSE